MVFDLIVSALVTVLVVTLTDGFDLFGNGLMNIGSPERLDRTGRPPPIGADDDSDGGCAAFVLPDLLFLMRETIRYIGKILEKVKGDIKQGF